MHRILKPFFDFYYNFDIKNTKKAQAQGLDWAKRLLLPAIEEVLHEFDVKGMVIRIEQLDIDLGNIMLQEAENELPQRLKNALREAIQKNIISHQFSIKHDSLENLAETTRILELLVHYLGTGRGSWRLDSLSKELQMYWLSQGVIVDFKQEKLARGVLGEPIGTAGRIFDFEFFWEIIKQTEPDILLNWLDDFGNDDTIQQRLVRQIKAEKIWEWLAGKHHFVVPILQNMFYMLRDLNDYTWKIPEKQLKGIFTASILQIWNRKETLQNFISKKDNIQNLFTAFLQKINTTYTLPIFFEKYYQNIVTFLAYKKELTNTSIYIFLQESITNLKKEQINNFLNNQEIINTQNIHNLIEKNLSFLTDKSCVIK